MYEPVLPSNVPRPLDQELLAWAAGFFDGEGSTFAKTQKGRPGYWQLQMVVPQSGHERLPEVLLRFRSAALGMGRIDPPNKDDVYAWRARGRLDAEIAAALIWPYLGEVKRAQAREALARVEAQYERIARRPARYTPVFVPHRLPPDTWQDPQTLELAWAAGFIDAEGWFGLLRANKRKDGTYSYRMRVSAPQHSVDGRTPEVLLRIQRVLGGTIERHGDPDDFKWVVTGRDKVARVLALTRRWLGEVKVTQAERALAEYDAKPRVRGTATTCVRGHPYDAIVTRPSGRVVKVCHACERIRDRAKRLARGGSARSVRATPTDPTRVYRVK